MMMYRLRFICLMVKCLFSKPRGLLQDFDLHFVVIPFSDTDITRLFTQTYAAYMGLARWHFIFASVFKKVAIKDHWAPVATSESITYKRSIKAFEKVILRTQLLCWDERRFFLRQTFFVDQQERASALVEGLVRGPKGVLNPIEVFRKLGTDTPSPAMTDEIRTWLSMRSP
jgi:acyl-CoA thioesterase FadM